MQPFAFETFNFNASRWGEVGFQSQKKMLKAKQDNDRIAKDSQSSIYSSDIEMKYMDIESVSSALWTRLAQITNSSCSSSYNC